VPAGEWRRVRREARTFVTIYAAAVTVSVVTGSTALVWLWLLPRLVGEPIMRIARLSEHAGRPFTTDVAESTRSLRVPAPLRLLAWNMPYHAAHHAAPSVPFHALPAWHERWAGTPPTGGYLAAQAGILREMKRRRTAVADGAGSVAG
jgi:fatty acid desaturase